MGHAFQTAVKSPSRSPGRTSSHAPMIMRQSGAASQDVPQPKVDRCACGGSCPSCQAKSTLKIGAADDAYEREADAVADRVMRMAGETDPITPAVSGLQRKCAACEMEDEEPLAQTKAEPSSASTQGDAATAPSTVVTALRSPGQALDFNTRAFFEPPFGHDFPGVRVHSGAAAARSARDVRALAYTVGHDIVFGTGRFAPGRHEGRRLIAHELSHVVQQSGAEGIRLDQSDEKRGRSPGRSPISAISRTVDAPRIVSNAQGVHESAQLGLSGSARPLPYLEAIQSSFGHHALRAVKAFVGGPAREANERVKSSAFTSGDSVAFKQSPDLHTVAHEAAHIVQQRAGVQLTDGVGMAGDRHEQHADAVADAVVRGESAEPLLDRYGTTRSSGSDQVQHQDGSGSTTTAEEEVCEDLRSALNDSRRVIALYRDFLAGNVDWDEMQDQRQPIANAAQGVTGAGHDLPQVVQDALDEVESFGLEEIQQMGAQLWEVIVGDDESVHTQWIRNEIERQSHFNLVLIEAMYENGCPDFPGTWRDFQEQVVSIGTRGREVTQQPGTTTTGRTAETRTAVAWVEIGGEEVLVLATEVGGSGRLRFVRWIDSDFRDLALQQARDRQGSIPSVPGTAVSGLPSSVPSSAARR